MLKLCDRVEHLEVVSDNALKGAIDFVEETQALVIWLHKLLFNAVEVSDGESMNHVDVPNHINY